MTLGPRCSVIHSFKNFYRDSRCQVQQRSRPAEDGARSVWGTKTQGQRSPIRELSKVQLRGTQQGWDRQGRTHAGGDPGREGHARGGTACAKWQSKKQRLSNLPQHGGEARVETLNPLSAHATAFIKCSVLCDRQGSAGGPARCPPSECSRMRRTSEPVTLRVQGLWEHGGGAVRFEGALRLRRELTLCPPTTQTAQSHGQRAMTE